MTAETTFFFKNAEGHNLYGVSHLPTDCLGVGVLFCHPFGDEKQLSYRTHVSVCRNLSRANIASFRFDSFGFGDSDGESGHATVASQLQDIGCAIEKFIELSGVKSVLLAGVRFGALLAAIAAEKNPKVSGIALIAPVTDGREFWKEQVRNQQMQYVIRGEKAPTTESVNEELKLNGRIEFEGGWFSTDMIRQIEGLCLTDQRIGFEGFVGICKSPGQSVDDVVSRYKMAGCKTCIGETIEKPFWNGRILYYPVEQHALVNNMVEWVTDIETNSEQTGCLGKQSA